VYSMRKYQFTTTIANSKELTSVIERWCLQRIGEEGWDILWKHYYKPSFHSCAYALIINDDIHAVAFELAFNVKVLKLIDEPLVRYIHEEDVDNVTL